MTPQKNPELLIKEITDTYIRKNFQSLADYFLKENQLVGFSFFEVEFQSAETRTINADFNSSPQDIIVTKIVGPGTVTFNHSEFTRSSLSLTSSGPCLVRFFAGTYWNAKESKSIDPNTTQFSAMLQGAARAEGSVVGFDYYVGSQADVSANVAQFSSLQAAIDQAQDNFRIKILPNADIRENINISRPLYIEGPGSGTIIRGVWNFSGKSIMSLVRDVRLDNALIFSPGSRGNMFFGWRNLAYSVDDRGEGNRYLFMPTSGSTIDTNLWATGGGEDLGLRVGGLVGFFGGVLDVKSGTYTRVGNLVTVNVPGHNLKMGHEVALDFTSGAATDGVFTVTGADGSIFTVTHGSSGTTSGNVNLNMLARFTGGGNINSVFRRSTGQYTLNFEEFMPNTFSYIPVFGGAGDASGGSSNVVITAEMTTSAYMRARSVNPNDGTLVNATHAKIGVLFQIGDF